MTFWSFGAYLRRNCVVGRLYIKERKKVRRCHPSAVHGKYQPTVLPPIEWLSVLDPAAANIRVIYRE